jgi:hypothetical protein
VVTRGVLERDDVVVRVGVVTRGVLERDDEVVRVGVVTRGVLERDDVVVRVGVVMRDGTELVRVEVLERDDVVVRVGVVTRDGTELVRVEVLERDVLVARLDGAAETALSSEDSDGLTDRRVERDDRPDARVMLLPEVTRLLRDVRLVGEELVVLDAVVPREVAVRLEGEATLVVLRAVEADLAVVPRREDDPVAGALAERTDREAPERACSAAWMAVAVPARASSPTNATRGRAILCTSDWEVRCPPLPTIRTVANSLRPTLRSSLEILDVAARPAVPCVSGPRMTRLGVYSRARRRPDVPVGR